MKFFLLSIIILTCCTFTLAQRKNSALLPESEAKSVTHPCSRKGAPEYSGTWVPTSDDIKKMESHFDQIVKLAPESMRKTFKISDDYLMQYIGIVVDDKRLIYINAFPLSLNRSLENENPDESWKTHAVRFCDGGSSFWGVLYNIETAKFSDIAFNGVA